MTPELAKALDELVKSNAEAFAEACANNVAEGEEPESLATEFDSIIADAAGTEEEENA